MHCNRINRLIKVLQILLAVVVLACCCALVVACKHEHNYRSEVTVQPTCTEVGEIKYVCEDCGDFYTEELPVVSHDLAYIVVGSEHWQSCRNCDYTTEKSTHSYNSVLSSLPSTCCSYGAEMKACVCGDTTTETLPLSDHSFTVTKYDNVNHWLKCADCTQISNVQPHKFITDVSSSVSTCVIAGSVVTMCDCGVTHTETLPLLNHNYITDTDSYVDATCLQYGHHTETCTMCRDVRNITDEHLGYGNHRLTYYPAKDMTATEDGNRNYWQCSVCRKYFSSKDCHEELTEDEVFYRVPKTVEIAKIDDLASIAAKMESEAVSNDFYKLTAIIDSVYLRNITLIDEQSDAELYLELSNDVDISAFTEGSNVTVKGRLYVFKLDGEMLLYLQDVEVLSVESAQGEYNLYVETNLDYSDGYIYIEYGDDYYEVNTRYYNVIMPEVEDRLTLTFYRNNSNLCLVRVIVNGQAHTVQNGLLTITVTGDTHIVLQFSTKSPIASVTLNSIDTSNNNEHVVDAYVSYKYQGGTNDQGRLHQNSKLTFNVNNANIVGINITYDADWLSDNPQQVNNKIVAVTSGGGEVTVAQGEASSRSKVVLSFDMSAGYVTLEYFANVKQARIVEITILYQSNNTFT